MNVRRKSRDASVEDVAEEFPIGTRVVYRDIHGDAWLGVVMSLPVMIRGVPSPKVGFGGIRLDAHISYRKLTREM